MNIKQIVCVTCAVIAFGDFVQGNVFQNCFRMDSISCLQMQFYKAMKALVNNRSIEIFNGIGLIKAENNNKTSVEQIVSEESVENAVDVESRQKALETYLITTGERFWYERTVSWNPAQTAKALVDAIPDTVTSQLTSFVSEGRGKEKKQMQMLMPLLVAFKLKLFALSAISLMVIALIAKKAILAAVISLMLSGISGLKGLMHSKPPARPSEVMGYQASTDWNPYNMHDSGRFSNYAEYDLPIRRMEPAPKTQLLIGHKAS